MLVQACDIPLAPAGPRLGSGTGQPEAPLLDACRRFEACVIQILLETAGMDRFAGGLAPGGIAQETHGYMWVRALATSIAQAGGLGLAQMIAREISTGPVSGKAHHGREGS